MFVFSINEHGVIKETCDSCAGGVRIENDVLSEEDSGEVLEGPFVSVVLSAVLIALARNSFSTTPSEPVQLISFLHPHGPAGEVGSRQVLVGSEEFTIMEVVGSAVVAERKTAESNHDDDKLV